MTDLATMNRVVTLSSASSDFTRYAKALLATGFQPREALTAPGINSRLKEILKAASGATDGSTWGSELVAYRELAAGFAASLAPWSSYDRIFNDGAFMRVPLKTLIRIASTAATGSRIISELAAKPIEEMDFSQAMLEPVKVVSFIVISNELARSIAPASLTMFGDELRRACSFATDAAFLAVLGASTGVASSPSTGVTASAFALDLALALDAVTLHAGAKPYLILPPNVCKRVAMHRDGGSLLYPQMTVTGGAIQGIKVVVSDATEDTGYLVDASQVATESETIDLRSAEHATMVLDDNPTAGSEIVSLWQNNLIGMRAERSFGVELLRANACALITGMTVTA